MSVFEAIWRILATLALVALNGYFVAVEFAAVSARMSRLEIDSEKNLFSRMALLVKKRLDLYLSSCQLGVTIASLALGAIIEPTVASLLEPLLHFFTSSAKAQHIIAFTVSFALSTSLHIIIGEQAPKNFAIIKADVVLPFLAPPLVAFTYLFYPFIWALNWISNRVVRLTGIEVQAGGHVGLPHTAEELRTLVVEAAEQGSIAKTSQKLLTSAFDFGDLKVRQIMTPRTDVDYLVIEQPIKDILRIVQNSAYTRLPLCDGDIDHVIGVIHMKDLFNHLNLVPGRLKFTDEKSPEGEAIAIAAGLPGSAVHVIGSGDIDLRKIRRDILFIPELLPVHKLLHQFQASRVHMGIVVDEYGATRGIVTLEDVLEEIVGEIEDEFDIGSAPGFVAEGENFRVSGQFPMHELREKLNLADVEEMGDVDTLNGYIVSKLGRWPKAGDSVKLGNYTARVTGLSQKRIAQVLVIPNTQETAKEDGAGRV